MDEPKQQNIQLDTKLENLSTWERVYSKTPTIHQWDGYLIRIYS